MDKGLFASIAHGNDNDYSEILSAMPCGILTNTHCVDADWFLHGECGIFAIALHDIFGYEMERTDTPSWDDDDDPPITQLVHVYCFDEDTESFIDIRGITDDEEEFFQSEFGDWVDGTESYSAIEVKDLKSTILTGEMDEDTFAKFYGFAVDFIQKHREWYEIN